jgi:diguanylate cyclase (GGDEF)-like protein
MSVSPRDLAQSGTRDTITRRQAPPYQSADSECLSRALDASRRQLEAAIRRNDKLLEIRALLTEKVSSLESELANANQLAHYDLLTGLPNRRLLLDRFTQATALADRHRQQLALLFFDLNDFKRVNDTLGHDAGDKLLQQVAARLLSSIRRSDTACRYGGDEFVVLLTEITDHEQVVAALKKIRLELAPPYNIDRHSIRLTVSNGMAIYPKDAQHFNDLIKFSDRSMFSTKSDNKRQSGGVPAPNIWLRIAGKEPSLSRSDVPLGVKRFCAAAN